jgi:hypothetical protein
MKIVEIRINKYGEEVAYLWDEGKGKIFKVLVEDRTEDGEPINIYQQDDEESLRRPVKRKLRTIARGEEITVDDIPDDLPDLPEQVQRKLPGPKVAPKSIVPPHLRGIFIKPDEPGAAVERRQV